MAESFNTKVVTTKPPKAGMGRPKGSLNKSTTLLKEAYEYAYQGIGGHKAFTEWARANQTEFYKLHSKLLPLQVTGEGGGAVIVKWENE